MKKNLKIHFSDTTPQGINLNKVSLLKGIPNMSEEQFKYFVLGVFQGFMRKISFLPMT